MIKPVVLSGTEIKVDELGGNHAVIANFGNSEIYASARPNVIPDGEGVAVIPSCTAINLPDVNGTVYLLGSGKVQLEGTDHRTVNVAPLSSGNGAATGSETMPCTGGIIGYFTPNTLDILGGRWRNSLAGNDIILSGGSAENECLHLAENDYGTLTIDEPMTIYVLFRTNLDTKEYYSVVSKHMTTFDQYRDFAVVVSPNITLSCRQSLVQSDISALAVHCVCITRNESTAKLYIDGEFQGETRAELGDYSGEYMLNKSLRGGGSGDSPGDHLYKMLAFGSCEHTADEIKQNSAWLTKKFFGW